MARQVQEFQKQNSRLKKLVADQALDMLILEETARQNGVMRKIVDTFPSHGSERTHQVLAGPDAFGAGR